jgi:acyl carrier protein
MLTRDAILNQIQEALAELFEIDPARVTPDANLNSDLAIDSIDAVDLIDRISRLIGKKVSGEDFRSVRTVGDLIAVIERLSAQ